MAFFLRVMWVLDYVDCWTNRERSCREHAWVQCAVCLSVCTNYEARALLMLIREGFSHSISWSWWLFLNLKIDQTANATTIVVSPLHFKTLVSFFRLQYLASKQCSTRKSASSDTSLNCVLCEQDDLWTRTGGALTARSVWICIKSVHFSFPYGNMQSDYALHR